MPVCGLKSRVFVLGLQIAMVSVMRVPGVVLSSRFYYFVAIALIDIFFYVPLAFFASFPLVFLRLDFKLNYQNEELMCDGRFV